MYHVTDIQPINTKKSKVIINDAVTLPLYKSEIRKYNIKADSDIPAELLEKDIYDCLYKRGRERCLYLLESMARTEYNLRSKLKKEYYPPEIIDRVICTLKEYNYIDDLQYARQYFECKSNSKSIMQIKTALLTGGVDKEIISRVIGENDGNETEIIKDIIRKKVTDSIACDRQAKNKIYLMLRRKGFKHTDIINVLESIIESDI